VVDAGGALDVEAERGGGRGRRRDVRFTCNFLFMCSGYYKYEEGYTPEFPGREDFKGRIVHPQKWPEDLDYAGKRVVVIGSGATAVTLVPEMAKTAAHVTMLQRSPTYVVARPAQDALANKLRRNLPAKLAYHLIRWRNVLFGMYFFQLSRRKPDARQATDPRRRQDGARSRLRHRHAFHAALQSLGPAAVPGARRRPVQRDQGQARLGRHQPDRHLHQDRHQAEGRQRARSRHHRHRDRLNLQVLGGMEVSVDGRTVDFAQDAELQGHDVFRRARRSAAEADRCRRPECRLRRSRPADGPAVILLHGWPYDIHSFVDVAPLLASAGYRVIVPYLRGYGTTRFLSSETFRNGQPSALAVDIIALMDALKIEKATSPV
jgi:hypothetical protein